MIVLSLGKWRHSAGRWFIRKRIYTAMGRWTPFVRIWRRHTDGRPKCCDPNSGTEWISMPDEPIDLSGPTNQALLGQQFLSDQIQELADFILGLDCGHPARDTGACGAAIDYIKELRGEVDLQRTKMTAASTASLQNTTSSVKQRLDVTSPYWSQLYRDVCCAVDREVRLRDQVEELKEWKRQAIEIQGQNHWTNWPENLQKILRVGEPTIAGLQRIGDEIYQLQRAVKGDLDVIDRFEVRCNWLRAKVDHLEWRQKAENLETENKRLALHDCPARYGSPEVVSECAKCGKGVDRLAGTFRFWRDDWVCRLCLQRLPKEQPSKEERMAFDEDVGLRDRVLTMMKHRGWSTHWIHRSAYLHLEAAELAEAVRGKRGDPLDESADVLITLLALSPYPLGVIVDAAKAKVDRLMAAPRYQGEEATR